MNILGTEHDCGPLLELEQIRRLLRVGAPIREADATIPVAQIVGTSSRARDFDAAWHPRTPRLKKRLEEILAANPRTLDEPIEVLRVDRAYFVVDGHKRVALARATGREFLDARVSRLPSEYTLTPDVHEDAIERTAREGEFRRHSGIGDAVPDARFALTEVSGYGELLLAVQSFAYDQVEALGRALTRAEGAKLWYEEKYLPTVAKGREGVGTLVDGCTDADVFLAMHRQERSSWGSECFDPECIADMVLAEQRRAALEARSPIDRVLGRSPAARGEPAAVLPLNDPAATSTDQGS